VLKATAFQARRKRFDISINDQMVKNGIGVMGVSVYSADVIIHLKQDRLGSIIKRSNGKTSSAVAEIVEMFNCN